MRTLEASQDALLASSGLRMVHLCKLTTYTDRLIGTVAATRYFSDGARAYKWAGGAVQQFEPWLVSATLSRATMNHLASPEASGGDSTLRSSLALVLRNALQEQGTYLYPTLRAENIEFASVELGVLFLSSARTAWSDLSDLTGSEMTWLFRGRVSRVSTVTRESITLEAESVVPEIDWLIATDPGVSPEDAGQRCPIVFGAGVTVRAINWRTLAYGALTVALTNSTNPIVLVDATAFPDSGTILIEQEQITYTGKSGNSLTGCTRGANGTTAVAHTVSCVVAEFNSSGTAHVWIASSIPASTISAHFYKHPSTGELVKLSTTSVTYNVADTTTVPGRTVASISFGSTRFNTIWAEVGYIFRPEIFVLLDGPKTVYTFAAGYAFDEGTGWSTSNATQTSDTVEKVEGTASQKASVTSTVSYATQFALDSDAANWSAIGSATLANEGVITIGGGSLKITSSAFSSPYLGHKATGARRTTAFGPSDWSQKYLRFWVYVASGGVVLTATTGLFLILEQGVGKSTLINFGTNKVPLTNTWTQVTLNLADYNGTKPFYGVTRMQIGFQATTVAGGDVVYFDQIEIGTVAAATIQRNSTPVGTVDLTTQDQRYRIRFRWHSATTDKPIVTVFFSNTAGVGTAKPASYWTLTIATAALAQDTWHDLEIVAAGVSSPATPNNVETFGIDIAGGVADVWVDDLRVATAATDYLVAPGQVINTIPDVLRYVLTQIAIPPSSLISTWNTDGSAISANVHAGNLAELGDTSAEVLARLGFEGRANLRARETAAGTEYLLLLADFSHAWPAAAETLVGWQTLLEDGRSAASITTRARYLYRFLVHKGSQAAQTFINAAAEQVYGRHDAEPVPLRFTDDDATATDVGGFYFDELKRAAAVYSMAGVPWVQGFKREPGDIVQFAVPWSGTKKARVLEVELRPDFFADLRLVEVP